MVFVDDLEAIYLRALDVGVSDVLVVGTDVVTSRRAVSLAERFDGWVAAVGVHPHECDCWNRAAARELRRMAGHPKVRAIGEIGLDHHRELQPRDRQMRAFADQCLLAMEVSLPIVIHSREALGSVAGILERSPGICGVLHSYTGDAAMIPMFSDLGLYISLSGIVTFPREDSLRATAAHIPLDRLLIETDAPFLSPNPLRGRRNEPSHLLHTATVVASACGMSIPGLAERTTCNARALFGDRVTV